IDCQNSESDALMITSTFLPPAAPAVAAPPPLPDEPPDARPATTPNTAAMSAITATSESENFTRVLVMRLSLLPETFASSIPQLRKRLLDAGTVDRMNFPVKRLR